MLGGPSCLRAADTNKGCWRFDSSRQAAAAQQGRPFTACQASPQQEAGRMWDSHKRDDGDTVTSNLRHAGTHKKTDTHTHTHPCHHRAAGQQLACLIVSHTDETAQLCPASFPSPPPPHTHTASFRFKSTQRASFFLTTRINTERITENKLFPSLFEYWKLEAAQSSYLCLPLTDRELYNYCDNPVS